MIDTLELSKIEQITLDDLWQARRKYGADEFGVFGAVSTTLAVRKLVILGLAEQKPGTEEFRITDKGVEYWRTVYTDEPTLPDLDWRTAIGVDLDNLADQRGIRRHLETDQELRAKIAALDDPSSWKTRLRAAGYTGKLELGAMVREFRGNGSYPQLVVSGSHETGSWRAEPMFETLADGYRRTLHANPYQKGEGTSAEEALANLMIEHPELWRKCPR